MTQRTRNLFALLALAAAAALSWGETKGAKAKPAPTAVEPVRELSARGAVTYRVYCSICHGRAARGDGKLAEALRQRPADLTQLASKNGGVFDAEKVRKFIDGREDVAAHGDSDMPMWGFAFQQGADFESEDGKMSEQEVRARIDDLVAYLATLQGPAKE